MTFPTNLSMTTVRATVHHYLNDTTWQSSQIHNEETGVWGALRAPQTPIFA